jgi:hypothetical protein
MLSLKASYSIANVASAIIFPVLAPIGEWLGSRGAAFLKRNPTPLEICSCDYDDRKPFKSVAMSSSALRKRLYLEVIRKARSIELNLYADPAISISYTRMAVM